MGVTLNQARLHLVSDKSREIDWEFVCPGISAGCSGTCDFPRRGQYVFCSIHKSITGNIKELKKLDNPKTLSILEVMMLYLQATDKTERRSILVDVGSIEGMTYDAA